MAIENTPLQGEITRIMSDGPKPISAHWKCRIETPDGEIIPIKLVSLDIQRKYAENFTDNTILTVVLGLGTFTHNLYPHKNDLHVFLTRHALSEGGEELQDQVIRSRRYRAILLSDTSDSLTGANSSTQDKDTADRMNVLEISFQLLDEAVEQIRLMSVGGIYTHVVPGELVRHLITEMSASLEVSDEEMVYGVDMVTPDNTQVREHVIVPHGTKVYDLPAYVQDQGGGIYNSGLGFYLQNGKWYLYPELNTRRFESTPRTLTVINVPNNRYSSLERTYRLSGKQVILLATGDVSHLDASNIAQLNFGNGTRFTDASHVVEGFSETVGNKTQVRRGGNNNEYMTQQRDDAMVNAPVTGKRITENAFAQASIMARRQGAYVQLVWENSDPDLIYPGMPVKFMYLEAGEVMEVEGVVMGSQHYIHNTQQGLVVGTHRCNSAIFLFINPKTDP